MRLIATLGLLCPFLALGGCMKETQAIKLNADGSGTITVTSLMKTAALKQMMEMAKAFGGDEKQADLFSEEQAKAKAAKMGEGVELVSSEKIKTAEEEGAKCVYSFKDITKLKISDQPDQPGAGAPGAPRPPRKDPLTFKFARQGNGNLLLTVVNPPGKEPKELVKKEGDDPALGKDSEPDEAQLGMMKEMFGGFKISIQLEVAGKIVKTNSPHVNGSTVTLLEMDFDKMLGDMSKLKKIAQAQPKSLEDAKALMKDFPGMKIHVDPEITVEFTEK